MKDLAELACVEFINDKGVNEEFKTYQLVEHLRSRSSKSDYAHSFLRSKHQEGDIRRIKRGNYKINRLLKTSDEVVQKIVAGVKIPEGI